MEVYVRQPKFVSQRKIFKNLLKEGDATELLK